MVKVDNTRLVFLIEARKDLKGSTSYYLSIGDIRLHLHSLDSVLDIINSNSYGYVEVK